MTEVCQEGAPFRGQSAWERKGVAVHTMSTLSVTLYGGEKFSADVSIVDPKDQADLAAIWCYCQSLEYVSEVRKIDRALRVTNTALTKVPFDLAHWQAVAAEKYPNGLPEPHSDDPTQWLFKGDIPTSTDPLHVAVARLLGYRWPDQPKEDAVADPFVDDDGIVCIPALRTEAPAVERLRELLRVCYGQVWSDAILRACPKCEVLAPESFDHEVDHGNFNERLATLDGPLVLLR